MRYNSLNNYLRNTFGTKVYKLAVSGGMTCPNRDGTLGSEGCIFCSTSGSGDFAAATELSIPDQIETAKKRIAGKLRGETKYIAYFQAFTNTYAPVSYLEKIFFTAISHPDIAALSVATRPDCLPAETVDLLVRLNKIKPVWVELGLQTIHTSTSEYIRRRFNLPCFEKAVSELNSAGINVIVHVILGLPFETEEMMLETVRYTGQKNIGGIKLQLLHVLEGTDLAEDYRKNLFNTLSFDQYVNLTVKALELLPPDVVIHRLTGDGPKSILISPLWSLNKKPVLQAIERRMEESDTWQGKMIV